MMATIASTRPCARARPQTTPKARRSGSRLTTKAMLVRPYTVRKGDTIFKISQKRGEVDHGSRIGDRFDGTRGFDERLLLRNRHSDGFELPIAGPTRAWVHLTRQRVLLT